MRKTKTYVFEVVEYHIVNKTYYIDEINKKNALARAKAQDWDDASGDEATGNIKTGKVTFSRVEEYAGGE
jgi:hypothetical protein